MDATFSIFDTQTISLQSYGIHTLVILTLIVYCACITHLCLSCIKVSTSAIHDLAPFERHEYGIFLLALEKKTRLVDKDFNHVHINVLRG